MSDYLPVVTFFAGYGFAFCMGACMGVLWCIKKDLDRIGKALKNINTDRGWHGE